MTRGNTTLLHFDVFCIPSHGPPPSAELDKEWPQWEVCAWGSQGHKGDMQQCLRFADATARKDLEQGCGSRSLMTSTTRRVRACHEVANKCWTASKLTSFCSQGAFDSGMYLPTLGQAGQANLDELDFSLQKYFNAGCATVEQSTLHPDSHPLPLEPPATIQACKCQGQPSPGSLNIQACVYWVEKTHVK